MPLRPLIKATPIVGLALAIALGAAPAAEPQPEHASNGRVQHFVAGLCVGWLAGQWATHWDPERPTWQRRLAAFSPVVVLSVGNYLSTSAEVRHRDTFAKSVAAFCGGAIGLEVVIRFP